jgi:alpha-D-ribose 1-methylphosphonate 5-triphosphate synthase subunit PhnH
MNPVQTASERINRETFLALMWALSYPGRWQMLPVVEGALETVSAALMDSEVSFYAGDAATAQIAAATGARLRSIDAADFVLFDGLRPDRVHEIAAMRVGDLEYPDDGATLIVQCDAEEPEAILRLSGPGINGVIELRVNGVPGDFWDVRASTIRFPLGIDVFLIRCGQVLGLPRTTKVDVCM